MSLIREIFDNVSEIYLSELTRVEFISAIWKKVRIGDIEEQTAKKIIDYFENDFPKYKWIKLDYQLLYEARRLFDKYGLTKLKTLDAIQLASASKIKGKGNLFHTNDIFLKELFEKEGLKTQN